MKDRNRRAIVTVAVASLLLLTWNVVARANPPATWNFDDVNREDLVENVDWQIMGEHQSTYDVPDGTHTYCTGVVRWRTYGWTGSTMSPGDLFGVFAVEKPSQMAGNCAGLNGVGGFRKWVRDHPELYGQDKRPAVLFLHGNQAHANFRLAAWIAYNLRDDEEKYRPFVIAINAPGQGIVCDCPAGLFSPPECKTWCGDQRSIGQGMDPPTSWVEGFSGYGNPVYPEHHILWGSVLNAAASTNIIKRVFLADPEEDGLGFVNDILVVGGFSAGGVASLLFNTQDERPDAVFAWSASGGWDQGLKQPGSTMAWLLTVPTYSTPFDPFYSIDCAAVRLQPSSYPVAKQKACQVVDYFDPINFTGDYAAKNPTLMVDGAQDEVFPIAAFQATYDHLSQFDAPVQRYLVGDYDHTYYWWFNKILTDYEAYGTYDPSYDEEEFYQFNSAFMAMRNYFQRVAQSLTPWTLPGTTLNYMTSWINGNKKTYRVVSCWSSSTSPQPYNLRFNISVDHGYHILPACNTGSWNSATATYTLSNTNYDYNSVCAYADDDEDGWAYSEKCPAERTTVYTGDVFYGMVWGTPYCRKVDVVFDGVAFPSDFLYWTELRYHWTADTVSSGPAQESGAGVLSGASCLRPRTVNAAQPLEDLLDAIGMGDGEEDKARRGAKGAAQCQDLVLDNEVTFEDGEIINYDGYNLVVTGNGALVGNGSVQINSRCDIAIKDGGRLSATNGTIGITARSVTVDGVIETLGDKSPGGVSVVATGDIAVGGAVEARSAVEGVAAGQVHLSAAGNVAVTGTLTATGAGSGGAVSIYAGQDATIDGAILADAPANGSFGGRMELHSLSSIVLGDSAYLSTAGDFDDGQILVFYGEDLSVNEDAAIDTGNLQEVNADETALPGPGVGAPTAVQAKKAKKK